MIQTNNSSSAARLKPEDLAKGALFFFFFFSSFRTHFLNSVNSEGLIKRLMTPPIPLSHVELCVAVVIKSVSFDGGGVGGG